MASLKPEQAAPEATLATLEAEAAADQTNLKTRLRLAKAYYILAAARQGPGDPGSRWPR
jgi:hypothetical protein